MKFKVGKMCQKISKINVRECGQNSAKNIQGGESAKLVQGGESAELVQGEKVPKNIKH